MIASRGSWIRGSGISVHDLAPGRSPDAKAAAAWALDEADRTGAPVEFLYAYEWPEWTPAASMVPATSVWPDEETDRAIKDSLAEAVTAAKQTHPAVRTEISTVHNSAALTLIDRSTHGQRSVRPLG